jgi:hypothetical protein
MSRVLATQQQRLQALQQQQHRTAIVKEAVREALAQKLAPVSVELTRLIEEHLLSAEDEASGGEELHRQLVAHAQARLGAMGIAEPKDLHLTLLRRAWIELQRGPMTELSSQVSWGLKAGRFGGADPLDELAAAAGNKSPTSELQSLARAHLATLSEETQRSLSQAPPMPGATEQEQLTARPISTLPTV